jgi:protein-disulfide isomerase
VVLASASGIPAFARDASGVRPQDAQAYVVAEVDGQTVTLADVERKRPSMFQARSAFYEAQRKNVDQFVDEILLERQAQREQLTVPQLLERHVNSKVPGDPPEESLRVYYEGVDTAEPYEAVRDKILEHLRQRRLARAKTAYIAGLRRQSKVVVRLAAPRIPVPLGDTPVRGRPEAPVLLVEYADYECPYCRQLQPVLDRVLSEFKNDIRFAYKDAPLSMHPGAQKAAEAAHCAGAQGKYWQYHELLVSAKQLDIASLKKRARDLGLDGNSFDSCLDSGTQAGRVQSFLAEAQALGLQGTPSLFVNGRLFSGLITYEQLRDVISEELHSGAAPPPATGGQ